MDFSGITGHMPSTVAGIVVFAIGGALAAGWITQEQATVAISVVGAIGGLLYKHQNI